MKWYVLTAFIIVFSSAPSGCSKHWCKNGCIVSFFRRHNDGTEWYNEWPYWKGWNHVVIFHYNISTTQRSHIMKAIIKERTQNMCFDNNYLSGKVQK